MMSPRYKRQVIPGSLQQICSTERERLSEAAMAALDRAYDGVTDVVGVDFPDYPNVGDSAIWIGTLEYLRRRQIRLRHITTGRLYDPTKIADYVRRGSTAIMIQGGGNLGDLWPTHNALRLKVVRDFPGTRIIQMPQSIHFQRDDSRRETRDILTAHPDFVLFVRDKQSLALAHSLDIDAILSPDAVHLVSVSAPFPTDAVLPLFRCDKEKAISVPEDLPTFDWPRGGPAVVKIHGKLLAVLSHLHLQRLALPLSQLFWNLEARARLREGVVLLARGEMVATDRLHAMLLALAMGRRVTAFDNSYGKLTSYASTWLQPLMDHGILRFADASDRTSVQTRFRAWDSQEDTT